MRFQRWAQFICLLVFLGLLIVGAKGAFVSFQESFFLQLDPSIAWITQLSEYHLMMVFLPAGVLLLLTLLLGRFFCGHVCPMGTTIDLAETLLPRQKEAGKTHLQLRLIKYFLLIALTTSALIGVSHLFWISPISLTTRLYALVLTPALDFILARGQQVLLPVWEWLDINSLLFWQPQQQQFSSQFFILIFFVSIVLLGLFTPRFWCRYLCPAGAIFALFSSKPLIRRNVSDSCTACGECVANCPMGAIEVNNPQKTVFDECIVCLSCEKICREGAVGFASAGIRSSESQILPERRQMIISGLAGAGVAVVSLTGLVSPAGLSVEGKVLPSGLIRPPAALPEMTFLSRCIRCGECMVACPTNTLQPLWFEFGAIGVFSPVLVPRKGFCLPDCHRCADVCPTGAITAIPSEERQWAKTGTAIIHRQKCLAWEHEKKCMVCDEVCPFDAIHFSKEKDIPVTVPRVSETNCTGCGYCEYHCPVQNRSAIVVSPMDAIRIQKGSFRESARKAGFHFSRSLKSNLDIQQQSNGSQPLLESPSDAPGFETTP